MTTATRPSIRTNLDHAMLAVAAQTDDRDAIALFLHVTRQAAYCQVQDGEAFLRMESRMRASPTTREAYFAWAQRCHTSGRYPEDMSPNHHRDCYSP